MDGWSVQQMLDHRADACRLAGGFNLLQCTRKGPCRNVTIRGHLVLSAWRANSLPQSYGGD
eukprot:7496522-Pyramimonas_sp.AAC.1